MMNKLVIGALLAGQLQLAAQPAFGAQLEPVGDQRMGAFGGLRVRVPFGGVATDRRLRAGLTVAPVLQDRLASGETRLRMGEGVELGLRGREPLRLSIAGRDLRRFNLQEGRDDDGGGISTGLWIAGGLVLVTVVLVGAAALALEDAGDED
jgi:hypothetical protein